MTGGRTTEQPPAPPVDAGPGPLITLGVIRTGYATREDCPRRPWSRPEPARIHLAPAYADIVLGLVPGVRLFVLWWGHQSDRDILTRPVVHDAPPIGVCASRGVHRPNPIGVTLAEILDTAPGVVTVRGMDCVDGTPLLDLKPALTLAGTHLQ
ncbi:TrmO family methyltransferase [Embleya sp. NPDC005575]|uniref:TrmO family methyltransferase domain-containing protein n=1 Tax=Embleya sp. NPDC005575 TaxID=3156892 RepID=UPI0033AA2369